MASITPRDIAFDALIEILEKGKMSHLVLAAVLRKYAYLPKQDRAFLSRLVLGTVEYVIREDAVLDRFSKIRCAKMKPPVRTILRMGVYQILQLDRVPDSAACNEAVRMAKARGLSGLSGFVNGVLRNISRNKDALVFEGPEKYCLPPWMIGLFSRELGNDRASRMMEAFFRPEPMTIRVNLDRALPDEVGDSLLAQGIRAVPIYGDGQVLALCGVDSPDRIDVLRDGRASVQDLSSSLAGDAAGIRPGDTVVDVCGAPGGKAIHAADILRGTGQVIVRDISRQKVELIRENIAASGFSNIRAEVWDAAVFDPSLEEKADVVIADLPCSGLGVIGRKPDIRIRSTPEKIRDLSSLQREILGTVWRYVKPGGTLVYSTCTLTGAENEDNVRAFLAACPFSPVDIRGRLGTEFQEPSMAEGMLKLLPGEHPCDGFFICVMRRNDE